jgi:hypothetical protein
VALGHATALAGCGSFQDPDIVLDFRVLDLRATPPEQVVDIDITNPAPPVELLDQLVPTEVCVLLSDRNFDRRLRWSMTLCNLSNDERCEPDSPMPSLGSGIWDDPDLAPAAPPLCVTINPDGNLLGVALDYLEGDQLRGLGGIYYGVSLQVGGEDADPTLDLWAAKSLRLMPRIPADIRANVNPTLDRLDVSIEDGEPVQLPFGRCNSQPEPYTVAPETRVRITPIETEGAREDYVVPTTDGGSRMFTESLTYQWLATAGNYAGGRTGGPRDPFGNPAILWTEWISPKAKDLDGPLDVELWLIQRDERLGNTWYESCIRVVP